MEKVVVILCKIENSYKENDSYMERKEILPNFFKIMDKIRESEGSSKILLSFISDNNMYECYPASTEVAMNISSYKNKIAQGENFYKDCNYNPISTSSLIEKDDVEEDLSTKLSLYIDGLNERYSVEDAILIYPKDIKHPKCINLIISTGSLLPLIKNLETYLNNKNKEKTLIYSTIRA